FESFCTPAASDSRTGTASGRTKSRFGALFDSIRRVTEFSSVAECSAYSPLFIAVSTLVLPRAHTGSWSFILVAQSLTQASPLAGTRAEMVLGRTSVIILRPFHSGFSRSSHTLGSWSLDTRFLL